MTPTIKLFRELATTSDFIDELALSQRTGVSVKNLTYLLGHAQDMGRVSTKCGKTIRRKINPAEIKITHLGREWLQEKEAKQPPGQTATP